MNTCTLLQVAGAINAHVDAYLFGSAFKKALALQLGSYFGTLLVPYGCGRLAFLVPYCHVLWEPGLVWALFCGAQLRNNACVGLQARVALALYGGL